MLHLDEGTLHAMVDGEIPSADLAPLQDHLASCASCRAALEEARALAGEAFDLVDLLEVPAAPRPGTAGGGVAPSRPTPAAPWTRWAWAATVVVAVGLGYGVRDLLPPPAAPSDAVTQAAPEDFEVSTPAPAERQAEVSEPTRREAAKEEVTPPSEPEATTPGPMAKATGTDSPTAPISAAPHVGGGNALDAVAPLFRDLPATPLPTRPAQLAESRREAPAGNRIDIRGRSSLSAEADALTLDEAMRWSAGRMRLLPDLVPAGLGRQGDTLRITYLLGTRVVVLEEIFHPDTVLIHVRAPDGFPADSLAALRARLP